MEDLPTKETTMSEPILGKCPNCGRQSLGGTARYDLCSRCGWEYYYGDAHATGEAQISRETSPGRDDYPKDDSDQ